MVACACPNLPQIECPGGGSPRKMGFSSAPFGFCGGDNPLLTRGYVGVGGHTVTAGQWGGLGELESVPLLPSSPLHCSGNQGSTRVPDAGMAGSGKPCCKEPTLARDGVGIPPDLGAPRQLGCS